MSTCEITTDYAVCVAINWFKTQSFSMKNVTAYRSRIKHKRKHND